MKFPLGLYRVSGQSMTPTYQPGDLLLGWRWFKPHLDQVVVVQTRERTIIKRIKRLDAKTVWLEGDNAAASTDSRSFGSVALQQIQAVIITKLG